MVFFHVSTFILQLHKTGGTLCPYRVALQHGVSLTLTGAVVSSADLSRPLTRGEAAQLLSAAMTLAEKKQGGSGPMSLS